MTNGSLKSLKKVKSIAECAPYFWPALSDNWSLKTILGLFESGRFTQVLLYTWWIEHFLLVNLKEDRSFVDTVNESILSSMCVYLHYDNLFFVGDDVVTFIYSQVSEGFS